MRVLWLLYELQLPFKLVIHPFDQLRQPEYLTLHPLARVPCLQMEQSNLFESLAICQFLAERYSRTDLHREENHPQRALYLQWLNFSETIAVHAANLVQQFIVIQPSSLQSETVKKLERRRLEKSLAVVEQAIGFQSFILTSGFSTADIALGYSIHLAAKFVDLSNWQNLAAYYNRLAERPAFQRSLPKKQDSEQIFNKNFYS